MDGAPVSSKEARFMRAVNPDEAYAALRAERERHNALYARDISTWTDDELAGELERTYGPVAVPPCPLCGRVRELQAIGGGKYKWACTGVDSGVPDWEHYERSSFEDYKCGGDERVIALVERYRAAEQDAQSVRDVAAAVRREDEERIAELERRCAEADAYAEKWMMKAHDRHGRDPHVPQERPAGTRRRRRDPEAQEGEARPCAGRGDEAARGDPPAQRKGGHVTRAEAMLESLRRCASCSHIRSSHPGGARCAGADHRCGEMWTVPCRCPAYVPGELSAEGQRMVTR